MYIHAMYIPTVNAIHGPGPHDGKLFGHMATDGRPVKRLTVGQIENLNFDPFELRCEITGLYLERWLNVAAIGDCFAIECGQGFFYRIK